MSGSDYLITDTVTITNANAGKVLALNLGTLSGGTGYTATTGISATGGTQIFSNSRYCLLVLLLTLLLTMMRIRC